MKNVLFLIPINSMTEETRNRYSQIDPHVDFIFSNTDSLSSVLNDKMTNKIKIIAARANSAKVVKRLYPHTKVIEIPITGYDVIRSFNAAKFFGKTIAIITTTADVSGLDVFSDAFNIKILNYLATPPDKLESVVKDALFQGAEVIVGGALTCRVVEKLEHKSTTLLLGPESVQRTLQEIRNIEEALELEASRQGFVNKLMDNIVEGVISLDKNQNILSINSVAEGIFGIKEEDSTGMNIKDSLPFLQNPSSIDTFESVSNGIATVNDVNIVFNKLPIKIDEKYYGDIITLHETNKVQKMENAIRNQIYAKNHVAQYTFNDIIGNSKAIKDTIYMAKNYAKTESNILISGETGTGKELFAQSIHNESNRKSNAFVAINCGALLDNLLESELFGYVEGAFTGANKKGKAGVFEIAHGGTIFLDEISEMDYKNQASLLRVIQEKYVVRLGSHDIIPVDVRIIAATNNNLKNLVQENKFRADLYFRLNVLNLLLPPLKARKGDILTFIKLFINTSQSKFKDKYVLHKEAVELLNNYSWPGNVRELMNITERILATSTSPIITKEFLQGIIDPEYMSTSKDANKSKDNYSIKEQMQIDEIVKALKSTKGNLSKAALLLGINRSTLWRRMNKYKLN
jgi:transcriptional regulator with PAS, ATPase and Fis domain